MQAWGTFFAAQVGASASLAGLIFVSVSLSLTKVIASPQLAMRAFQALVVLLEILIVASLALVPQRGSFFGAEVLILGGPVWVMVLTFDRRTLIAAGATYRNRAFARLALSQAAALLFVVAGTAILATSQGIYWLVPAMISSYLIAMLDAWVLLIEINR